MKKYEQYLFDETEQLLADAHRELATDENNDGLFVYKTDEPKVDFNKWSEQAHVIDGIYSTVCKLFNLENIHYCCGGGTIFFTVVHEQKDNVQSESPSPYLSREKLIWLKPFELSELIIEMFLDRDNWSKEVKYSQLLSDGNGNWLI